MKYTNEAGMAKVRAQGQTQQMMELYGPKIWDIMTFWDNGFNVAFVAEKLCAVTDLMPKTAHMYVTAFFAYCRAAPEEFSGPASKLTKVGQGKYMLTDNPEL